MSVIPFPSQTTADRADDEALKAPIATAIGQLQAEAVRLREIAAQLSAAIRSDKPPIHGSRESEVRWVIGSIRTIVRQTEGKIDVLAACNSRPTMRQIERRNIRFGRGAIVRWEMRGQMLCVICEPQGEDGWQDYDDGFQREILLQEIGFNPDDYGKQWHMVEPDADTLDRLEDGLRGIGYQWIERIESLEPMPRYIETWQG